VAHADAERLDVAVAPELAGWDEVQTGAFAGPGGASFARSLAGHGLIDEYRPLVQPVAFGAGCRCCTACRSRCGSTW
jgi:hypothetical protein